MKLVEDLHEGTFCKVIVDGSLSDDFEVKSGVIQGGILSLLLFNMVIDYVMRKVAEETNARIVWGDESKLVDLDYADDIVLIDHFLVTSESHVANEPRGKTQVES